VRAHRILIPDKRSKKSNLSLGRKSDKGLAPDSDDESVVPAFATPDGMEDTPDYAGWNTKYRLSLDAIIIKRVHGKKVDVVIQDREFKQYRDLIFDSEEDAKDFAANIDIQKEAGERRAAAKLKAALGEVQVDKKAELTLLVEIVAAWNLPAADFNSSDPFVVCFMNGREVHRTKHIPKT
jgi:hypothetical protein